MRALALLSALLLSAVAAASDTECSYGMPCRVRNLTTTGTPPSSTGLAGNASVSVGSYSATEAGIWLGKTTRSTTNFSLLGDASGNTYLNSSGTTRISVSGTARWNVTATALFPHADNTYDLGAASSNRVKAIYAMTLELDSMAGTAGSGTGITASATARVQTFVHKLTVAETALTAAATTQDVTVWTVPAGTRVQRVVVRSTTGFTGGTLSAMTVQCGPSAGSTAYLLAGSIFTANVLGDVVAEIGAGLVDATRADIPSMTATTDISCRFTATGDNVVNATAGSLVLYIEGTVYP